MHGLFHFVDDGEAHVVHEFPKQLFALSLWARPAQHFGDISQLNELQMTCVHDGDQKVWQRARHSYKQEESKSIIWKDVNKII